MLVMVGMPAAADPWSSAEATLEALKPRSVLTTCTLTNPWPSVTVEGTGTVMLVGVTSDGVSGPALTGPLEVATKKLTLAPGLKKLPEMLKLAPTSMTDGIDEITGAGGDTKPLPKVLMSTVPHPVVRSNPGPAVKPVTPLKLLLPVVTSRKPRVPGLVLARA